MTSLLLGPAAAVAGNKKAAVQLGGDGTIQVQNGSNKVTVTAGGVQTDTGDEKVTVTAGGVEADTGDQQVTVTAGGVDAETGSRKVNVRTGAGNVNVQVGGDDDEVDADDEDSEGLDITGSDRHETLRCSGGTAVSVNGSDNDIKLLGECGNIDVTGSDNRVTVEAVERISVTGTDTTVLWKRGVGRSKPKVVKTGSGNKVKKTK
ncbi:MAG TPA: DUF3060 domain-containing protein [Myxococcaceae bacterium]|nr:DUF3060 domain-containing protein [Myxococcaceae bacterium]